MPAKSRFEDGVYAIEQSTNGSDYYLRGYVWADSGVEIFLLAAGIKLASNQGERWNRFTKQTGAPPAHAKAFISAFPVPLGAPDIYVDIARYYYQDVRPPGAAAAAPATAPAALIALADDEPVYHILQLDVGTAGIYDGLVQVGGVWNGGQRLEHWIMKRDVLLGVASNPVTLRFGRVQTANPPASLTAFVAQVAQEVPNVTLDRFTNDVFEVQ